MPRYRAEMAEHTVQYAGNIEFEVDDDAAAWEFIDKLREEPQWARAEVERLFVLVPVPILERAA